MADEAWADGYAAGRDDEAAGAPLRVQPGRRVVLITPGDVLLIGGIGDAFAPEDLAACIKDLSELVRVPIAVFEKTIEIGAIDAALLKQAQDSEPEQAGG